MAELVQVALPEMNISVIGLEDLTYNRPIPGDMLKGLWAGDLRTLEELVAACVNKFPSTNRPSFLNASIIKEAPPRNYGGDISDCAAIILRNGEEDYPKSVNVAYAVMLNPPLRGVSAAAIKAQYRPGKNPDVDVERQLVRLKLEDETQEAFVRLADTPSQIDLRIAVSGLLRAVDASQPFDGQFKPKVEPKPKAEPEE